jgi:hypothetical protein
MNAKSERPILITERERERERGRELRWSTFLPKEYEEYEELMARMLFHMFQP